MPEKIVWYTPETLEILKANMHPWVFAVAMSNLPVPMALERYSPYRNSEESQ